MNTGEEKAAGRDGEHIPVPSAPARNDLSTGEVVCPSCGAGVAPGARSCRICHRGVYRTCYCGWQLPASEADCPNCGADWSQSMRVARKSRSRTPRRGRIAKYALTGAILTLFAGVFGHIIVTGLAIAALGEGESLPAEIGPRLSLAAVGVAQLVTSGVAALSRYATVAVTAIALLAVGAAGGVVVYLIRLRMFSSTSRNSSRSVRRKRRNK